MTEIEHLRSENARLQDLLDRRPAMNEGLPEAYVLWSTLVYRSDALSGRWVAEVLRSVQAPAEGAH